MTQSASERQIQRWGWAAIAAAAFLCLAMAAFNLWQQQHSAHFHEAILHFQTARAQATLGLLDMAIAEDGRQTGGVAEDLARTDAALNRLEQVLPLIPGGSDADAVVVASLHDMRLMVARDQAALRQGRPNADLHHALQQAYRTLVTVLEARWVRARDEVERVNQRKTMVANAALLTALLALGATGTLLGVLHHMRRAHRLRLMHLTRFRLVVGRINDSVLRAHDFVELAEAVCRIASEIKGVVCVAVHLHDPASQQLRCQAVDGERQELIGREPLAPETSSSIIMEAFARQVRVVKSGLDEGHGSQDATAGAPVQSAAALPLFNGKLCIGVLTLLSIDTDYSQAEATDLLDECAASISFSAEKIAAQAALRESESRYRTLVEASPDAILVICEQQVVMANSVALQQLGASDPQQVIGHQLLEFVTPAQQARCLQRMQQVLDGRQPLAPEEMRFVKVDGSPLEVEAVGGPFDYQGQPAILSLWHDLSSRRKSQRDLAERERDLLLAQKAAQIGSAVIDLSTGLWMISPVGQEVLGLEHGGARPLSEFTAMLDPANAAEEAQRMRVNVASGQKTDTVYAIIRPLDGARRWIRVVTEPEVLAQGPSTRRIGVVQDVTQARLADQRIRQLTRLYEALSRVNAALSREPDFDAFCAMACQVLVETGGLAHAGVDMLEPPTQDAPAQHRPCASFGSAPDHGTATVHQLALQDKGLPFGRLQVSAQPGHELDEQNTRLIAEVAEALNFAWVRHSGELARTQTEKRISAIVDTAMDAIITCDDQFHIVTFNDAAAQMFATPRDKVLGRSLEVLLPNRFRDRHKMSMLNFRGSGETNRRMGLPGMVTALRSDGHEFPTEASISHVRIGERSFYTVIMRDITERLAADARIARLTRLYAAQSHANEAIVRGGDWHELCEKVCRVIVEHGELHSALIRVPDADKQQLQPFAAFGHRSQASISQQVRISDEHPVALCFREHRPVRMQELQVGEDFRPARMDAMSRGAASALVVPILGTGEVIGTLSVFSRDEGFFDGELERLLFDLADNLAFAWEKLHSEAEVRESEERYRALFEHSPDGLRIISEDHIVKVNPAYVRMFGENPTGQHVQQAVFDHLDPATLSRVTSRYQLVKDTTETAPPDEQLFRRNDGVVVPVETTSAPFRLAGKLAHLTIIRDLREARARQRALQAAETRYRSLVETSLSGIALVNHGHIEYANLSLARMLGFASVANIIGQQMLDLVEPQRRDIARARMEQMMQGPGQVFPHGRLQLLLANGQTISVDMAAASIDIDGQTTLLVELRDVTREVLAKEDLRELNRGLEARVEQRTNELVSLNRELALVNRDLESFSYSVAHDLRAPLRHMAGFAQMVQMDVKEQHYDELPSHVERIVGGVNRMSALIDGMLAVARASHTALNEEDIPLAELLTDVLQELHPGPEVSLKVAPLPQVRGDRTLLRQVWTNLLSNAIKYSGKVAQPRIQVKGKVQGQEYVFSVQDNGAGFDPAHAGSLFGVFKRLHGAQEFAGTGVGLAIVQRIVERHGGRIWADAKPQQGAVFSFTLPLERIEQAPAASRAQPKGRA